MDSGNSGSMQSSSGGSEEYAISAFINNNPNPSSHVGGHRGPPPPQQHHQIISQSPSSSAMFDPLGNYFDHPNLSRSAANPNSLLNLDAVWSKQLRSDPNCTDLGGFMGMPSSSSSSPFLTNQQSRATLQMGQGQGQGAESGTKSSGTSDHQPNNNNNNNNKNSSMSMNTVRNSKKRSRASRRAPTTVLTTDTSNFRAMVQEFTGIPAPPFTSSPFPRTRLDLFGTHSSFTMRSTSSNLDLSPPPHYLLRPFLQKIQVQPPPFVSSSSIPDTTDNTNNTTTTTTTTTCTSTSINYQLSSELGLLKQPHHNLLNINMQNPILNFQSLLQTPSKYPLPNPSNDSPLKMGTILDEFGLSHGHVNTNLAGLHNMTSSSDGALPRNETSGNPPSWGEGAGSQQHEQGLLRSINGSFNSNSHAEQRASNGKVPSNFSASSSDFHGDKGPENVATRSEGMVEQWICSSD